jgi:hypothetical protein
VDRADDALPWRTEANHTGGRLEISARELDTRKSAARDEDAGGGEDYGENRDDERCVARRPGQQPAGFQDVPMAIRDLRAEQGRTILDCGSDVGRRRHARLRRADGNGSVVRPAYRGHFGAPKFIPQIERPRRDKTMGHRNA